MKTARCYSGLAAMLTHKGDKVLLVAGNETTLASVFSNLAPTQELDLERCKNVIITGKPEPDPDPDSGLRLQLDLALAEVVRLKEERGAA